MSSTRSPTDQRALVVVRHAKSSWDDPGLADHDRPLAPRGRKALRRLRSHLEQLEVSPGLVWCSSSRRTRETLDGIRQPLGVDARIEIDGWLYGADVEELLSHLRTIGDDISCALLIGHNPGLGDLVDLVADGERAVDRFPTAAVAVLAFDGSWTTLGPARASLTSLWTPRDGEAV
jgi:phosphohistidine phosphatase